MRLKVGSSPEQQGELHVNESKYSGADGCPLFARLVTCANAHTAMTDGPVVVLLHGGGPDHQSLLPLAKRIADVYPVILPDVRGYGRSICRMPSSHTWTQYAQDVISLLDQLGVQRAILGGTGLGATISLRTAVAHPERVQALVLISIEEIEDDAAKQVEIEFMDAFEQRVRKQGIEAAWKPILPDLAPVISSMVRDAIPRSDPESIAAATAIGHDRSFRDVSELTVIAVPTLIFPGIDARHPRILAEALASSLRQGRLVDCAFSDAIRTAEEFSGAVAPAIRSFLHGLPRDAGDR